MAAAKRSPVTAQNLQGLEYFQRLGPLLERLRPAGTERDGAGRRQWCCAPDAAWRRLYFCSPPLTRLRGRPHASTGATGRPRWGSRRTAPGALSEAAHVVGAAVRREGMAALGGRLCTPPCRRRRGRR